MSILERALRMGEAKQFKAYSKRVERINNWEPELQESSDEELKEQFAELRERAREGEDIDELLPDVLEGRIQPGRVFDRVIGLEEVPDGYRAMDQRESIKVMINF